MARTHKVGIVMGSDSDWPTMKETVDTLKYFGIDYDLKILSTHRTPDLAMKYARAAERSGYKVLIAGAGGAAHLAGIMAALTPLPVIGVPMQTSGLGGVDSLYSIVQMPGGVPVATVAIGKAGAKNAAILAAQIIGVGDLAMREKVKAYKRKLAAEVREKVANLKSMMQNEHAKEKPK
jgi:5-(carboxyamino)imidazole ribonucleotide mutase